MAFHKSIKNVENLKKLTKRSVLSIAAQLFDPLGFVEPFLVKSKILMQDLWKAKLGWDDELPDTHAKEWKRWFENINDLASITIKRPYFTTDYIKTVQIHVFCDSSIKAYGAVLYLRSVAGPKIQVALYSNV